MVADWWVLKWGLKISWDALALAAMERMFFRQIPLFSSRVGV
jgi:hypothetical protein